jgi:acyl carrier protein
MISTAPKSSASETGTPSELLSPSGGFARRIGKSLFEATALLLYLFTGPVIASVLFAWLVSSVADSWLPATRGGWLAGALLAPVLYPVWLLMLLTECALENQLHALLLWYRKPARAAEGEGFRNWLVLSYTLCLYQRARLILTLPLVLMLTGVPIVRWIVFLSYSHGARLGRSSVVLGRLFDPDLTDVGDQAVIGVMSLIVTHGINADASGRRVLVTAPVVVGRGAVIGGGTIVGPGAQIGAGAIVEPASYVAAFTQIGPEEVWSGNPAKFIRNRMTIRTPQGSLTASHTSRRRSDTAVDPQVRELVAAALNRLPESLPADASADTLAAWDSVAQLAISNLLQARHGIVLPVQEIFRLRSMEDVGRAMEYHR